jgi:hypothetical protein
MYYAINAPDWMDYSMKMDDLCPWRFIFNKRRRHIQIRFSPANSHTFPATFWLGEVHVLWNARTLTNIITMFGPKAPLFSRNSNAWHSTKFLDCVNSAKSYSALCALPTWMNVLHDVGHFSNEFNYPGGPVSQSVSQCLAAEQDSRLAQVVLPNRIISHTRPSVTQG